MKYQVLSSIVAGAMTLAFSTGTHDYKWPYHPRPHKDYTVPTVFQAAGPDIASIQGTVDQFRAALGGVNNGNVAGPLDAGRREINWDGGGSTATSPAPTPFSGFLVTRGALFTTPGTGFVQAPLDGLVTTFNNPDYANIFQPFSPVRVFVPVNSNRTTVEFFVPGGGDIPAVSSGFGAIFSDVDEPDGRPQRYGSKDASTYLRFYDAYGELLLHQCRRAVARGCQPVVPRRALRQPEDRKDQDRHRRSAARPLRRAPPGRRRHGRLHLRRATAGEIGHGFSIRRG